MGGRRVLHHRGDRPGTGDKCVRELRAPPSVRVPRAQAAVGPTAPGRAPSAMEQPVSRLTEPPASWVQGGSRMTSQEAPAETRVGNAVPVAVRGGVWSDSGDS